MIKGNVIYMGYGDMLIGNRSGYELNFTEMEEVFPMGTSVRLNTITIKKIISIKSNKLDLMKLDIKLDNVYNKKDKTVSFDDYILDFNNFNSRSIENLQRNIKQAIEKM